MKRLILLRLVLLLVVTTLIGRLYQLQLGGDTETRRYSSNTIEVTTTRYVLVSPRRGEILAGDGETLLAESVPIFSIAVLPGSLPPRETPQRQDVLGRVALLSGITSTLTFSPSQQLQRMPTLRRDLRDAGFAPGTLAEPTTWEVAPPDTLAVLDMTWTFSDVLTLNNPIEDMLAQSNARGYETVIVQEDIPHDMTLLIRENSTYLPGVVVVEDYQRRYPQSNSVPSLSHMLGYIGRIDECELVTENPASSWVSGVIDVVTHVPDCGVVDKTITPDMIGTPHYRHDDQIGKDGLESSYEEALRGTMGIEMIGVDALERPVSAPRTLRPIEEGHNLVMTIDIEFQQEVEAILQRWIDEGERRRQAADDHRQDYHPITNGVAVVLDVNTGEVLAMVSLPAYDNNVWVDRERADELQNLLSPADPEQQAELARLAPLTNRAVAGQFPPGSSLKPFVGAAALQQGVIQPDTRLRDPGRIALEERGGQTFILPNSVPRDNGEITVSDALMVSSNVFFASISGGNNEATNLGEDTLRIRGMQIGGLAEGLTWFGLGQPSEISLPGEASGRVPTPNWKSHALREPWTTGDTYNTSIGQGYLEVTPLQITIAMAAIANNGTLYRPHLVREVVDSEGTVLRRIEPEVLAEVPVDTAFFDVMRDGMRRSITEGINAAARNECSGLSIAGKTGTAEFGPNIITEDDRITRQSHAWFVGFAPYDNPEIVVVVLLEGTGDMDDGSSTLAVPAVTQIMQAYFGINPPPPPPDEDGDGQPDVRPTTECPVLPQ